MSSADDPQEIQNGLDVLNALVTLLSDPTMVEKLRKAQKKMKEAAKRAEKADRQNEAMRGTCPTCRRQYGINKDGSLRRHGKGACVLDRQLPRELIPAVLAIAQLGDDRGEVASDDGTGKPL